jgi:site-specific DNA-methyltransferase (adenine-specific)
MGKYDYKSKKNNYLTPKEVIKKIFEILKEIGINNSKFELDTCCSIKNIPAYKYFIDGEKDGLNEKWEFLNYCNPPYNECEKWVKKAHSEYEKGNTTVLLIPARTETKYWHEYILKEGYATNPDIKVKYLRKGISFINPNNNQKMGVFKNPLAIVIFDGRKKIIDKEG